MTWSGLQFAMESSNAIGAGNVSRTESKGHDPRPVFSAHKYTYLAIFIFTLVVYFRPHEAFPGSVLLTDIAFWSATATLLIYFVSQTNSTGSITRLTVEAKCVLFLAFLGLVTIPIARDPALAWNTFYDPFIRVMAIFVVAANVLTSERRIKGLMWLGVGIGGYLSYQTYELYMQGAFNIEGYRVGVDFGGMFGNPNDMSIHLVMFIPVSIALGLSSRGLLAKMVLFSMAGMMSAAIAFTQSRTGFLGLVAIGVALIWTLGRGRRLRAVVAAVFLAGAFIAVAPGDYGKRILSIFDSSLDVTGSSGERSEALNRSILVTLRNPWGIGQGNSVLFGERNLETHNAYTQVSSELGVAGLAAYLVLLIYPLRRLSRMEGEMSKSGDRSALYFMAVGTHAAIIGYMVSSFFASVAYQWYVYYPIAYAVGLRSIYESRVAAAADAAPTEAKPRMAAARRRYFVPG